MNKKLGIGTWGLGGEDYGKISSTQAYKLLLKSYKSGVNFFDTAPLYGNGRSEKYLGKLIDDVGRKNLIISTKCGMLPHKGFNLKQNFSLENLNKDLQNSLSRLNTNYIDYYLLHSPDLKKIDIKKILNYFKQLRIDGIIKGYGISLRSPLDYLKIKNFDLDIVEFNFNLFDQRALDIDLFNLLELKNIKSICRTPLCFGFLTGKILKKKKLDKNDHRRLYWKQSQFEAWTKAKFFFLKYYEKNNYDDYSEFALHFCLSHKFSYVIPGIMSSNDLEKNLKSLRLRKLSQKKLDLIYQTYRKIESKIYITKK